MRKLASIMAGVFQVRHSHAEAKKCYGSKIVKDKLTQVTIGLAEPMSEGDMVMCLLMSQRSGRIYNVVQRVSGGCKVIHMQFMLQRYSHLEETHLVKRAIIDIRYTPHRAVEIA
jgi:hypothetical protein